jgi:hypothetical protein
VAYKPKRGRFCPYKAGGYQQEALRAFVDDILGGGGDYEKLPGTELALAGRSKDEL